MLFTIIFIHYVFVAWGYVGHGVSPNVRLWVNGAKSREKRNGTKIIVSRSHAGDVQKVVQASLGEHAIVEPAGGAGEYDAKYSSSSVIFNLFFIS